MNILRAFTDLIEIFLACLPIFFVLILLEKLSEKLSKYLVSDKLDQIVKKRLAKAEQAERDRWAERAHQIDEDNK